MYKDSLFFCVCLIHNFYAYTLKLDFDLFVKGKLYHWTGHCNVKITLPDIK